MPVNFAPEAKTPAEQIGNLLTGTQQDMEKKDAKRKEDVMNQMKLYGQLRENGYSAEDATARVNRMYGSTNFLEKVLTGNQGTVFNPPTGEDKWAMESEKQRLENKKTRLGFRETRASIKEKEATAKYKTSLATGDHANEKALYDENGDIVAWVPKTSAAAPKKSVDEFADFSSAENNNPDQPQPTQEDNASKLPSVPMTRPDGSWTNVAPISVKAAKAKGYIDGHIKR